VKLESVAIGDIKKYLRNARQHGDEQVKMIADSIREFGFLNPVLLDEKNEIIAGHGRYEAALQLGMKNVPCIRVKDLTPEQVVAYRLADNKISDFATDNRKLLAENLEFLKLSNFDITLTGYELELKPVDLPEDIQEYREQMIEEAEESVNEYDYDVGEDGDPIQIDSNGTAAGPYYTPNLNTDAGSDEDEEYGGDAMKVCPRCGLVLGK
jgi:hypothetical protein